MKIPPRSDLTPHWTLRQMRSRFFSGTVTLLERGSEDLIPGPGRGAKGRRAGLKPSPDVAVLTFHAVGALRSLPSRFSLPRRDKHKASLSSLFSVF